MAKEKSLSPPPRDISGEKPFRVRRGRVDSVDLYEIKENELELLEKGSPVNIYLNFSIFLLTIAFAALATLISTEKFKYEIAQTFFVVIIVVGFLLGVFLIIMWYKGRSSISAVIQGIRSRIPPETPEKENDELETEPKDKRT